MLFPTVQRHSRSPDSRGSTPGLEENSIRDKLRNEKKRPRCRDFDGKCVIVQILGSPTVSSML